ncbi:MAG: hypothetical protein KDE58_42220 [Caldilineaceae bacterium]|nr:hypothetical protein [Caldilineaceae bacterium]
MIRLWRTEWFERIPPTEQVYFGNGQIVSADDILDGHFQQITGHSEQNSSANSLTTKQAQQERHTKIEQIAPHLTPLTDLAENVAETMADAQPTTHFRTTLNKALTETHRQHSAQRTIGIRTTQAHDDEWKNLMIVGLIITVLTLGVALYGQWLSRTTYRSGKPGGC